MLINASCSRSVFSRVFVSDVLYYLCHANDVVALYGVVSNECAQYFEDVTAQLKVGWEEKNGFDMIVQLYITQKSSVLHFNSKERKYQDTHSDCLGGSGH